jgi:hypothetical protein
MLERLEDMQLKDTLRMFNGLVERCFSECVTGFRSKALTGPEEKCVSVCANKYLKHSVSQRQRGRVGARGFLTSPHPPTVTRRGVSASDSASSRCSNRRVPRVAVGREEWNWSAECVLEGRGGFRVVRFLHLSS